MAIDVELKTLKQNNTSWPLTFKASNRFPIVANRVFATLEKAQQYIDDTAADASAYPGIVLAVVQDTIAKNNGVYYVQSVAMAEGETGTLVKVGGTETETATTYSAAVTLSQTLVTGQLIKVTSEETVGDNKYKAGFYIVEAPGTISALDTSTGAADEVGALKTRVDNLEANRVLVTDFETYKGEVTGNLATKANAQDLSTHTNNTDVHIQEGERKTWNDAVGKIDAFLLNANMTGAAIDTLVELQAYINTDSGTTAELLANVSKNADDITALTKTVSENYSELDGKVSAETSAREAAISGVNDSIKTVSDNLATLSGKVDDNITAISTLSGDVATNASGIADNLANIATISGKVEANITAITKNADDISALTEVVGTKAAQSDLEALAAIVGNKDEKSGIFGELDALANNVYTKEAADEKFLTADNIDSELNGTSTNAVQNKVLFAEFGKVRDEITSAVTGDVGAALLNYVKKTDVNTLNDIALYNESGATRVNITNGTAATVTTDKNSNTITIDAKVSTTANNALSIDENGLYVKAIMIDGEDVETANQ